MKRQRGSFGFVVSDSALNTVVAIALFTIGALASAAPAGGQSLNGTVTMSDGTTRAAGVIVVATDVRGASLRALTNTRGDFSVALPAPGRYSVQVLRVGFRPTLGPSVTVAPGETATVQITLADVAVSLRTVTVQGDDVCRTSPDSGALVARAWEEARKAIISSQLTATDAPLVAEWIVFTRTLDPSGRIVRGLEVRNTTSPTTHAFRSVPAEVLAARGYVIADSTETTFYAPDGDVLLSESFAGTHCFQIVAPGRGADTLVGVSFRPSRDERDIRDIEGTFWLDNRSAELRWLDFRYTNMPAVTEKAASGGRVEFLHLGTGSWVIGRWSIRMPQVSRMATVTDPGVRRVARGPAPQTLSAIQVTGGEVTKVTRRDTTVYRASGAALDVQLLARDERIGVAGASITLVGTGYSATAGSNGRIRINPVLEGRYEARVRTPLADSLGAAAVTREIEVGPRARTDTVRLPGGEELLTLVCKDSVKRGESLVRGIVRDTTGRAVANAAVTVTWQGQFKIVGETRADRMAWTEQSVGALTDSDGRWRVCGVPREVPLFVRVRTDFLTDARRLTLDADQPLGAMDLVPHPPTVAADPLLPKPNRAMVEFLVTDEAGEMIAGATLEILAPTDAARTMGIGPSGRALLPDAAPGRLIVRVRKIGYRQGQVAATIAAGRNTVPIILSTVDLPQLDTVRIVGDERRATGRLDDFEPRRLIAAATRSITRAEIVKRNPVDTWQMLTNVPAMKVVEMGGEVRARSTRVDQARFLSKDPCFMKVMVDGVVWMDSIANLSHLPPPDQIHGIEVFAGPASIPVQYGGSGANKWCGLIAIWTR